MATSTTNLGLTKPSVNDAADIGVLNSNFDKIDTKCNPALFAPSGYGLGENAIHAANADEISANGYYETGFQIGANFNSCIVWHNQHSTNYAEQYAVSVLGGDTGAIIHRTKLVGTWQPWEWVNPPMQLGVEYRTTKRCEGKPVYAKRISLGTLLNNSEKTVSYGVYGYAPVSHEETFVSTSGWKLCTHPNIVVIPNGDGYCTVKTTADFSMYTGYTTLEYVYN